jgi:hypothetical protein
MNDNNRVREVVDLILDDYKRGRDIDKTEVFSQPDQDAVRLITQKLLRVLYPGYYRDKVYKSYNLDSNLNVLIEDIIYNLTKQIGFVLQYQNENERKDQSYTPDRAGVRVRADMTGGIGPAGRKLGGFVPSRGGARWYNCQEYVVSETQERMVAPMRQELALFTARRGTRFRRA